MGKKGGGIGALPRALRGEPCRLTYDVCFFRIILHIFVLDNLDNGYMALGQNEPTNNGG